MRLNPDATTPLDVVVVEDHDLLREELVTYLTQPNWQVRGAENGQELDGLLRNRLADLLVVDLNLPYEDGLSIARRMRAAYPDIGIIMLTARAAPQDRVAGYEDGADIYLTKPAHVGELKAAITSLALRLRPHVTRAYVLDPVNLTVCNHQGVCLELTLMEALFLHSMAAAPDRQLGTLALQDTLRPSFPLLTSRENIAVAVSRFRAKFARSFPGADPVKAIRGYGYKLMLDVTVRT